MISDSGVTVAAPVVADDATDWEMELADHPDWPAKRSQYRVDRNYDPIGFMERIYGGSLTIKQRDAAGEGRGGIGPMRPRRWQRQVMREVAEHRLNPRTDGRDLRWLEAVVKSRQLGFSTLWDGFIWSDSVCNPGTSSLVTAHQVPTLDAIEQNFRWFAGRDKKEGKAGRLAARIFEPKGSGSPIRLGYASQELGRGDSITHTHVSEADYIEDLDDMLDSVLGGTMKTPWGTAELESTLRRGSSTEFKEWLEELTDPAYQGDAEAVWQVRFLGWMDDETAYVTMDERQTAAFLESHESPDNPVREYERWLFTDRKATPGQVRWWRRMYYSDGRKNLLRTQEMYPTTLDEALKLVKGADFFDKEAIRFYRKMVRPAPHTYYVTYDGMRLAEECAGPHVEVWFQPEPGKRYIVGVDTADADQRSEEEIGSENYVVVLDLATGRFVAQWHGFTNSQETAIAAWRLAKHYNDAMIVPEVPPGGSGVLDFLVQQLSYGNVYEREVYGNVIYTLQNTFGFNTRTGSRGVIVGRFQDNFNDKTLGIYSDYLLDQIIAAGKRKGRPLRKGKAKLGEKLDDGFMACCLTMAGHDNAVNDAWAPKDALDGADTIRAVRSKEDRAVEARNAWLMREQEDGMDADRMAAYRFMEG